MYTSHLLVSSCLVAHMASAGLVRLDKKALYGRRVPHEHAHEKELTSVRGSLFLNNPAGFVDPVFGLLGAAAAAGGANGADPDCLQQLIADQAFTNAKAINDIEGMTAALVYRALERNTGRVGLASPLCTSVQAVNPEVAAVRQHQDASGEGAIALNKQITLELARQIASFGGDPLRAIESGTFAPGDLSDASARGGSCNDVNDPVGCIYTQDLLVPDVTPADIAQAIQNISPGSNNDTAVIDDSGEVNTGGTGTTGQGSACVLPGTVTVTVTAAGATSTPTVPVRQDVPVQGAAVTSVSQAAELVASDIDLGDCPNIALAFAQNLEGRKETSFIPANLQQFPHGSAQNPNIIADFICDNLVNQCGLKRGDPGHVLCEEAQNAIANLPRNGAAADIFNNFFGIATNFAVIPVIDNQGNLVV